MSVLDVLSGVASAVGKGFQGYGVDQENDVKSAMAAKKAADEAERNRVLNLVAMAGIDPDLQGRIAGAKATAEVPAHVDQATRIASAEAPIKVDTAAKTAAAVAPISQGTHAANREFDVAHPAPVQPSFTFPTVAGADGKPVIARANTKTGAIEPTDIGGKPSATGAALAAPIAAKVGQFGEMLKKASDLLPMMESLNVGLGQSAANDVAQHGLGVGSMRLPGTRGVGSALMNRTPEYSQYQAALAPFILAAAHALSGARINQDQVEQIRKSIEVAPGDWGNKGVMDQKTKNIVDLINSIGGSLPSTAIGDQEGQMDAAALTRLQGMGYRSPASHAGPVTHGAAPHPAPSADPEFDALMARYKAP